MNNQKSRKAIGLLLSLSLLASAPLHSAATEIAGLKGIINKAKNGAFNFFCKEKPVKKTFLKTQLDKLLGKHPEMQTKYRYKNIAFMEAAFITTLVVILGILLKDNIDHGFRDFGGSISRLFNIFKNGALSLANVPGKIKNAAGTVGRKIGGALGKVRNKAKNAAVATKKGLRDAAGAVKNFAVNAPKNIIKLPLIGGRMCVEATIDAKDTVIDWHERATDWYNGNDVYVDVHVDFEDVVDDNDDNFYEPLVDGTSEPDNQTSQESNCTNVVPSSSPSTSQEITQEEEEVEEEEEEEVEEEEEEEEEEEGEAFSDTNAVTDIIKSASSDNINQSILENEQSTSEILIEGIVAQKLVKQKSLHKGGSNVTCPECNSPLSVSLRQLRKEDPSMENEETEDENKLEME